MVLFAKKHFFSSLTLKMSQPNPTGSRKILAIIYRAMCKGICSYHDISQKDLDVHFPNINYFYFTYWFNLSGANIIFIQISKLHNIKFIFDSGGSSSIDPDSSIQLSENENQVYKKSKLQRVIKLLLHRKLYHNLKTYLTTMSGPVLKKLFLGSAYSKLDAWHNS